MFPLISVVIAILAGSGAPGAARRTAGAHSPALFVIGLAVLAASYLALLWYLGARRERNAKREAVQYGVRSVNEVRAARQPVSFARPAAKGFHRPGNGDAA